MRLLKITACGIIGLIIGLSWSQSLSFGYFQSWQKLPSPPSSIVELVTVGDGYIIAKTTDNLLLRCSNWRHECWVPYEVSEGAFYSTEVTKPCDFSSPEFSSFKSHPKNITDCIQGMTQYPEGAGMRSYALDRDGNIWEWSHIFAGNDTLYAVFAPYCCPSLGLVIGLILFAKRVEHIVA